MPKLSRRLLLAVVGATAILAGCNQGDGKAGSAASAQDMSLGDPNAPVKVVEYASLTCGHCAAFHEEVFPQFKEKYIDTGQVHYTLGEFLTPPAEVAAAGFLLARCAGEERYFSVIDAIFRSQREWSSGDIRGSLLRVAQSVGMTEQQFNDCVSDEDALKALNDRVERAARQHNINATPTFIVNGEKVKEGAMSLAELDAAIAAARE